MKLMMRKQASIQMTQNISHIGNRNLYRSMQMCYRTTHTCLRCVRIKDLKTDPRTRTYLQQFPKLDFMQV